VAARSKAWVCGLLVAGIAGSNSARGMDVCLLCLYVVLSCVGRGLCDGLITRPEESYRVSVCVWSKNPEKEGHRSILDYKFMWMNERIINIYVNEVSARNDVPGYLYRLDMASMRAYFRGPNRWMSQQERSRCSRVPHRLCSNLFFMVFPVLGHAL
jgi:hypothetical protein